MEEERGMEVVSGSERERGRGERGGGGGGGKSSMVGKVDVSCDGVAPGCGRQG